MTTQALSLLCLFVATYCDAMNAQNKPRRITSNSISSTGMSLKTQLELVRATKKKPQAQQNARPQKKGPSSKKVEAAAVPPPAANATQYLPPLLLVDGYNAIFASEDLSNLVDNESLESSRRHLADLVAALSNIRGWSTQVVFDGTGSSSSVASDENTVVFTNSDSTADAYIEKTAYGRRGQETYVASDDGLVRIMSRAHGANILSCQQLLRDCEAAKKSVSLRVASSHVAHRVDQMQHTSASDIDRILREEDADGNWDFNVALRRRLIGDDILEERAEFGRKRAATSNAHQTLLKRIQDNADAEDLVKSLYELEDRALADGLMAQTDITHSKIVFGLLHLIREDEDGKRRKG